MPMNATINARKNADWMKQFQYLAGGVGVDMTGGRLLFQVREKPGENRAYISLTSDPSGGITITNILLGKFTLAVRVADMADMQPRDGYVHDLLFERPDGLILTIWEGVFNLGNGVTR